MDKKALLVGVATMGFFGAAIAGVYHLVIGREPPAEYEAVDTSRDMGFPTARGKKAATPGGSSAPPPGEVSRNAAPWDTPSGKAGGSSLGFVQGKGRVAESGGPGGSPESAKAAAAAGDIGGMLRSFKENGGDVPDAGGDLTEAQIRNVLQDVVDGVHNMQPDLYEDFLDNKYLKRIAERYDKTKDFKRFIKDLGLSKSFYKMLKAHAKTRALKDLTKEMFRDKSLKKDLLRIFFQEDDNPYLLPLVAKFGQAAGLPSVMVKTAQSKSKAAPPQTAKKKRRAPRSRPTLRKVGYGGYEDGKSSGQGAPAKGKTIQMPTGGMPKIPAGMEGQIPDEYKKYLPK